MRFTKIPNATFQQIQLNAGVVLSTFNPASPSVADSDIIGATSGGVNFTATPSFSDYGEDIDNCPKNTKELKTLDDVEVKLSGSFVTVTPALAKRLAAAADLATNKVTPRRDLASGDFADIWFVGDYSDKNDATNGGFIAIRIINALSTGGFQLQTTDKEKGKFSFEFTGHYSISAQTVVPYEIYVVAGSDAPGIEIEQPSIEIAVGDTVTLRESHYPTANSVTWASSATGTATVSNGVVEGKAAGYCVVTASITESAVTYSDACMVHVVPAS